MILIYVTCRDYIEAESIAIHIVHLKLAACANIFPIVSIYSQKDHIRKDKENVLILKTIDENYESIKKEISKIHSYDVPAILKIKVADVNDDFGKWVAKFSK